MVRDIVSIACGTNHGAADLKTCENDPGFVDQSAMDLALRKDATVFADLKNFSGIPFQKIGLQVDGFRPTLPPYRREFADWQPGESASGYDVLDRQ